MGLSEEFEEGVMWVRDHLSFAAVGNQRYLFKPRLARKKIENLFFEPVWRGKLFQMKV